VAVVAVNGRCDMKQRLLQPKRKLRTFDLVRLAVILIFMVTFAGCFDSSTDEPPPAVGGKPSGPTVVNDTLSVPVDTAGVVSVLDNDTAISGTLSIVSFDATGNSGGDIADLGGGLFSYTPPAGYEGSDTFTYTVSDSSGVDVKGTVSVTVSSLVIPNGKAFYASNCAVCHAAGTDDTSVAFMASNLAKKDNLLQRDLSIYGGQYQLMGAFYDVAQKNIDELKAYLATL